MAIAQPMQNEATRTVRTLLAADEYYKRLHKHGDDRRRSQLVLKRANAMRKRSLTAVLFACVVLAIAIAVYCSGDGIWLTPATGGLGLTLFVLSLIFDHNYRMCLRKAPDAQATVEHANKAIAALASGDHSPLMDLPADYRDETSVSDLLKVLMTDRANTISGADSLYQVYRQWRAEEQHEQAMLDQYARQANAAKNELQVESARLAQMESEIRKLKQEQDDLERENNSFRFHISQYR